MAGLLAVAGLAAIVATNAQTADDTATSRAVPFLAADINGDHKVDTIDLSRIFSAWGKANTAEDINGSGSVETGDLSVLFSNWTR